MSSKIEVTLQIKYTDDEGVLHESSSTKEISPAVLMYKHEKLRMLMSVLPKLEGECLKEFLASDPKYHEHQ